jgi:hypothetical protein
VQNYRIEGGGKRKLTKNSANCAAFLIAWLIARKNHSRAAISARKLKGITISNRSYIVEFGLPISIMKFFARMALASHENPFGPRFGGWRCYANVLGT